jgi:sigma-E factor negative regulatory protein RseA
LILDVMEILMDAHKKNREHISALGDGELATGDLELAVAALRSPDGAQTWITYHLIGDALRAPAAPEFSPGFNERLAARLAAEPAPLRRSSAINATLGAGAGNGVDSAGGAPKVATTP